MTKELFLVPNNNTQYKNNTKYGCGALILNERAEILLLLRSANSRNDCGLWSQPGGAIDSTLDMSEVVIHKNVKREIKEEIGVEIDIEAFLTTTCQELEGEKWIAYSYRASISKGIPMLCEVTKHDDLRWFPINGVPKNTNQVTLDSIAAYIENSKQP